MGHMVLEKRLDFAVLRSGKKMRRTKKKMALGSESAMVIGQEGAKSVNLNGTQILISAAFIS